MRDARHPRVVSAWLIAAWLVVGMPGQAASAADLDCDDFLRMHGLMRSAARVCGFSRYNDVIVERAESCYAIVGSRQGARDIYAGVDEFTSLLTQRGQDALCPYLIKQFPMVVRP